MLTQTRQAGRVEIQNSVFPKAEKFQEPIRSVKKNGPDGCILIDHFPSAVSIISKEKEITTILKDGPRTQSAGCQIIHRLGVIGWQTRIYIQAFVYTLTLLLAPWSWKQKLQLVTCKWTFLFGCGFNWMQKKTKRELITAPEWLAHQAACAHTPLCTI